MLQRLAFLFFTISAPALGWAEVVARYDGGVITEQDLARHAQVLGMPEPPKELAQQRAMARELVLTRVLAEQAAAAGLAQSEEFARLWRVEQRALLAQQLQMEQGLRLYRAPERFYRLQSLLVRMRLPNGLRLRTDEEAWATAGRLRHALVRGAVDMSAALSWEGVESEAPKAQAYLLAQSLAPTPIHWALERQAEPAPAKLWRVRHHTPLYQSASQAAPAGAPLDRFMIVASHPAAAPEGWQAVGHDGRQGYLPSELLEPLDQEDGYSQPIHIDEGLLILRLLGSEQHGPESYRNRLQETRFADAADAQAQAARVQEEAWLQLNQLRWQQWYNERYAELGLTYQAAPALPPVTGEPLHAHEDFVLTRTQLDDYLHWLGHHQARRGLEAQPFDPALYAGFLRQAVLAHVARRQGLDRSETARQRQYWHEQQLLAALQRQHAGAQRGSSSDARLLERHGYSTP